MGRGLALLTTPPTRVGGACGVRSKTQVPVRSQSIFKTLSVGPFSSSKQHCTRTPEFVGNERWTTGTVEAQPVAVDRGSMWLSVFSAGQRRRRW